MVCFTRVKQGFKRHNALLQASNNIALLNIQQGQALATLVQTQIAMQAQHQKVISILIKSLEGKDV